MLWVNKSLTWKRWIVNFDRHLMVVWKCMRIGDFMWIFKVIFILEILKIAGDRVSQWEAEWWNFLFSCEYLF